MEAPRAVPFRGRAKWVAVAGNLLIAAVGLLFTVTAFVAVPADVRPMRVLGWYTAFATVATLVLAVALATTPRLPTIRGARLGDDEALVVRAWPVEWVYNVVIDLGLGVTLVVLMALGVRTGEGWTVPGLLVGLVGAWFLARVVLGLAGRRRNDALWLTARDVVHDSRAGRDRVDRDQVVRARRVAGTDYLLLAVEGASRLRDARSPGVLADAPPPTDCSWTAH